MDPRRSGFSMSEMLVALGILAVATGVLATNLLPQLHNVRASRIASDLGAISEAVVHFYSDTEHFPATAAHLTTRVAVTDTDLWGRSYQAYEADVWRGPYLDKPTSEGAIPTGSGSHINPVFGTGTWSGRTYLRVAVGEVDQATARLVSHQLEGDTLVGSDGTGDVNGLVRWKAGQPDSLIYLARTVWR